MRSRCGSPARQLTWPVWSRSTATRSSERVEEVAARLREAGHEPQVLPNPYWERTGAVCFVDPDGYWLVVSPEAW